MVELKRLRQEKNLTMKQVADMVEIAESTYSLIESGRRRPSPEVAQRIQACLGYKWTRFFEKSADQTEAAG